MYDLHQILIGRYVLRCPLPAASRLSVLPVKSEWASSSFLTTCGTENTPVPSRPGCSLRAPALPYVGTEVHGIHLLSVLQQQFVCLVLVGGGHMAAWLESGKGSQEEEEGPVCTGTAKIS